MIKYLEGKTYIIIDTGEIITIDHYKGSDACIYFNEDEFPIYFHVSMVNNWKLVPYTEITKIIYG